MPSMPTDAPDTTQLVIDAVQNHGGKGAIAALMAVAGRIFFSHRKRTRAIHNDIAGLRGEVTARINGLERRLDQHGEEYRSFQATISDHIARTGDSLARLDERAKSMADTVDRLMDIALAQKERPHGRA